MPSFPACLRTFRSALVAVVLAQLAGCTTASNSGVAKFLPLPPKSGFAAVYVGRPFGFRTSVFPVPIEVDGRPLVSLGPNDYTRIDLPPGRHTLGVPESYWTRTINGMPHAVDLTLESGKSYYLLPTRWAENVRPGIAMVGNVVVPTTTADGHSSFSVQTIASAGAPPPAFLELSYVTPVPN